MMSITNVEDSLNSRPNRSIRFGTVDQMGVDVLGVDVMGVDVMGVYVMVLIHRVGRTCLFLEIQFG